ncbi:hypothetical protein BBJ29_006403 [Phytophthora kernoviae]|uniref:Uncharacterized protein n=1 Tax=Phytophthora kernoviae TaxID=325452 RepID=A0A3F2RX76_9STRA|nr:hypothetical protein BBJ29_006403 [Phytophthora kernoviae]RLN66031.1 hypothetical protein BBP00_00002477 [Phytophthora kernoviae]
MYLTVRDADSKLDTGVSTEIDVLLVLQQQSSTGDNKQGGVILDKTLIGAAFEARNKRLAQSRKLYPGPALETHLEDEPFEQLDSSGLDNFEEFDISSIRSGAVGRKNHLPVLTIRGCTPAEYSSLENTRYLIDVGQHTVRNGGEVEWEITIESLYSAASIADPGLDSVEYRLMLVDKNARSWLQLSRERGTLDRAHSYQSVVLYFLRGVVGVYSTFMVLQNMTNPSDLKVIHVRNDSMFFSLAVDESLTQPDAVKVDLLDHGICAGRRSTLLITIQPMSVAVFRVKPDAAALWKHHQLWDHSVKEHVTLYNIKQFAEHYQVTLCFTCSNVASFYIPPNISESYPVSALEDIVAKFLQNYEYTWKWLISYHEKALMTQFSGKNPTSQSVGTAAPKLSEILNDLETVLDLASPLSPRNPIHADMQTFDEMETISTMPNRDDLYQLVQSYRALYFDFYYITDELVCTDPVDIVAFPRLLLPWIRQLGHFLSFFPENQEATQPLRQVYEQLRKFEA